MPHHYSKGSEKPPLKSNNLRLYSMRFCPYAERARLVLAAKGIDYECININLKDKPEWFFELNPLGKVPVIETRDGKVLYESTICSEYLEDQYPRMKLFPEDPFKKHKQRLLVETLGSKISAATYKFHFKGAEAKEELDKQFSSLEEELKNGGSVFLGGDKPGMADLLIWPWIERIVAMEAKSPYDIKEFPTLSNWYTAMMSVPAVKDCSFPAELHVKFFEGYRAGDADSQLLSE